MAVTISTGSGSKIAINGPALEVFAKAAELNKGGWQMIASKRSKAGIAISMSVPRFPDKDDGPRG